MVFVFLTSPSVITRSIRVAANSTISFYGQLYSRDIPSASHPLQHLLFVDILTMAILTSVRWYFTVVVIYISLLLVMLSIFFMCLLATCMSLY